MKDPNPVMLWFVGVPWFIGIFLAIAWRARSDWGKSAAVSFGIPIWIASGAVFVALMWDIGTLWSQAGLVVIALFVANNLFNFGKSRRGPQAIAFRKRLAAASTTTGSRT
jgi:hypothetical protein